MNRQEFDVIVVGGGHAGVEAARAAAQAGADTALVTMSRDTIAQMSCNPAIGGLAKGQIVREVDALGGLMGLAIDATGIQFRMLNRSKGPAVWAPRAQADKWEYQKKIVTLLEQIPKLIIIEDLVEELIWQDQRIEGVLCHSGRDLRAGAVVITAGTFLRGLMHTGLEQSKGGRYGEPAAERLSESLEKIGLKLERLKTGTPARIDSESVDYSRLESQPGDQEPAPFSFLNEQINPDQLCCWVTWTNEKTHAIIRNNLDRAPLYTGQIQSTGPRYCPSIETKIIRFADKPRHQIFLEPEGRDSNWMYCNGISNSLPVDVQEDMLRSIEGLEQVRVLRYAYAIEYDYVPPLQIHPTLETKVARGLFLAGQINGTSGYEEAAGQGLVAGLNAARYLRGEAPVVLGRDSSYIGVMIDDLVTRGVDEPYRMFTSRAENRLLLRSDNADQRLTPWGRHHGLIDDSRWHIFQAKRGEMQAIHDYIAAHSLSGKPLASQLRQQNRDENWLLDQAPELLAHPYRKSALQNRSE